MIDLCHTAVMEKKKPKPTPGRRKQYPILGEKLAALMTQHGLSQEEFAAAIGRVQSRISYWMRGQGCPDIRDLMAIARFFRVRLEWLCDDAQTDLRDAYAPRAAEELSDQDQLVWRMVREMGTAEAIHRLMKLGPAAAGPGEPPPPPTQTLKPLGALPALDLDATPNRPLPKSRNHK